MANSIFPRGIFYANPDQYIDDLVQDCSNSSVLAIECSSFALHYVINIYH